MLNFFYLHSAHACMKRGFFHHIKKSFSTEFYIELEFKANTIGKFFFFKYVYGEYFAIKTKMIQKKKKYIRMQSLHCKHIRVNCHWKIQNFDKGVDWFSLLLLVER